MKIDRAGIGAIAKGAEMKALIGRLADEVAGNVREQGIKVGDRDGGRHEYDLPVTTETTVTDRARGRVIINHPAGQAVQAKHGALTKAASEAGMEVKDR